VVLVLDFGSAASFCPLPFALGRIVGLGKTPHAPTIEEEDDEYEYDSLLHTTPLFPGFFSAIAAYLV
jgi:hypothetical protein